MRYEWLDRDLEKVRILGDIPVQGVNFVDFRRARGYMMEMLRSITTAYYSPDIGVFSRGPFATSVNPSYAKG